MSTIGLQASAAVLFGCWIMILLAMRKLKPEQPTNQSKEVEAPIDEPLESSEQIEAVFGQPFARWEHLWAKGEEQVGTIIENPLWNKVPEAYSQFRALCDQKNICIVDGNLSNVLCEHPVIHFDDCNLMSYLWEQSYSIHLVEGKSLLNLLEEASPFSLIIISVKDDGSQTLSHDWQEKLSDCGIRSLTREHLRYSYINIIWKKYEKLYVNLYEECSADSLSKMYSQGDFVNDFKFPVSVEVSSGGLYSGNCSSIKINGREYSRNLRGMNIAVYDVIDSKVEGVHRVDTFITMFEDTTVYRALPFEGEKYVF
ncbi:hypothetical protein [Cohnella herbarum]|uniref:Uncharacterized protein n=1 Tax=Cohnella herbarum TaxID=2728023 RepID=A0A7Z2VM63_9BACL|nr:hypothetical protein [Cohnella herbarum]QJD85495.1 hypothetical protein HH215_21465 [Cohnella herbarum]